MGNEFTGLRTGTLSVGELCVVRCPVISDLSSRNPVSGMSATSVAELLQQVHGLRLREADEERPYDHLYAAADLCLKATADVEQDEDFANVLLARRGLILLDTDLLADGQACVERALAWLEPAARMEGGRHHVALLQECYNALGALQSGRSAFPEALSWLGKAESLYASHRRGGGGDGDDGEDRHRPERGPAAAEPAPAAVEADPAAPAVTEPDASATEPAAPVTEPAAPVTVPDASATKPDAAATAACIIPSTRSTMTSEPTMDVQVEANYTSTLFFFAQVAPHKRFYGL